MCVCASVCVCIKMVLSVSALDLLWEWINFSPQDCQSNITPKTKLKKKKKKTAERRNWNTLVFFFFTFIKFWS